MSGPRAQPPDRGHIETEQQHADSACLDALDTRAFIDLMAGDHAQVVEAVRAAREPLARFIDALVPRVRGGGRLVYLGAGTSGRLGVLDASECPPTFQSEPDQVIGIIAGGDAALRRSSEGREDDPEGAAAALATINLGERDTLLGIAAGGTTPYVLGALHLAREAGAMTALLTCATMRPSMPPPADHLIYLPTGPELLTGSTRLKAGSATKLALNIISTALFTQLGKVYGNLMVDLRATNDKLRDRALRIILMSCPELERDGAAKLLEAADGELKTAIVAQRLDLDPDAARALLRAHDGSLRAALEPKQMGTADERR